MPKATKSERQSISLVKTRAKSSYGTCDEARRAKSSYGMSSNKILRINILI